uniref:Laminin N-terminal domain-containing protein n=1 Tax=Syphacia muris TaxID=451379 RepID=A0A0N5AKB7_9BILA
MCAQSLSRLIFLLIAVHESIVTGQLDCDILDPSCRARYRQNVEAIRPTLNSQSRCNYQDIWLIPGRADASCSKIFHFFRSRFYFQQLLLH